MNQHVAIASRTESDRPVVPIGMPTLVKMAFDGADLAPLWNTLVARVNESGRCRCLDRPFA